MEDIVIQLHPDWLNNPDADLRYLVPEELIKLSSRDLEIIENGYEYDNETNDMFIFLIVSDSEKFLVVAKDYLSKNRILNNNIWDSCIIAREKDGRQFEVLYKFSDKIVFKIPPE